MTAEAEVQPAAPELVHAGRYALYATPGGGRHLSYRPDGIEQDIHIPDIPPEALGFVQHFLENGLPPAVLALLQGGSLSPLKALAALRGVIGNGNGDGDGDS